MKDREPACIVLKVWPGSILTLRLKQGHLSNENRPIVPDAYKTTPQNEDTILKRTFGPAPIFPNGSGIGKCYIQLLWFKLPVK